MESTRFEFSDVPYPGLRPFRPNESDVFFGRERQTDDLLARLDDHRFLGVVGPSGCGKSSLVAAGLMPALATGFMAKAGAHWRVAKLRPGERPLHNLAKALLGAGILDKERAAQPDEQVSLESALRRGPLGLVEIMRGSALEPDANLLVFADQFEELFRFSAGARRDEAEAFVALLLASAAAPGERIYVAITMRSDFLGECAPFHGLPEAINDGLYLTPRLTRDECAACITGPARVFDADVEPALVNRLLNDFGPDPDQLPLLQHALLRMWNRHDQDRQSGAKTILGIADYDAIGGLSCSLSNHANEAFAELDPDHQRVATLMFQRLSDSETARRDRRAPAHVQEIAELAGVGIDDVRRVADVFRRRDRCFLVPRERIALTPEAILDVSHESLLRQWDKAAAWIAEEAEAVALYRRLREAAHEWKHGEALISASSLDRALAWRAHATATWARRYGTEDDFSTVCDFITAGEKDRDAKYLQQTKARSVRIRRSLATIALGALTITGAIAWFVRPLFYVWEHTSYYAGCICRYDAPHCFGKLTNDQVRHRPTSLRVVTAGLFGSVKYIEAVNGRDELVELPPEYGGTNRGRNLASSRWVYEYDASGQIASEHQYTSRNELVQGKIYVPLKTGDERLAVFIGPEGTPVPVKGQSDESTFYWAERVRHAKNGASHEETISYLGSSGEPIPGRDRAFATRMTYDDEGYETSVTSLDASGQPMNDAAGNATMNSTHDAFGNLLESIVLDKQSRRTRVNVGWTIRRGIFDAFGNEIEESYFDENDRPVVAKSGWHKEHFKLDDEGNVDEIHYFDQEGRPVTDAEHSCYGYREQHDAMGRPTRRTCIDADGAPRKMRDGYVTSTWRYDDHGRVLEETTLDAANHRTPGKDAYVSIVYDYDKNGREIEHTYRGIEGKPINNKEGYAKIFITYEDSNQTESVRFLGINGDPVLVTDGYASLKRQRDVRWNIIKEHYYDKHGDPVIIKHGYAGWHDTYDAKGQKVETVYLGKADEAILTKNGYAGWKSEYDDLGQEIAVRHFGMTRKPTAIIADGIAGWHSSYDSWDREVERTYADGNGEAVNSFHGEAGWRAEYDSLGNQTKLQYIDSKGAPTLHSWADEPNFTGRGYALVKKAFDAHGNLLEEAYFDIHGERVASPEGWSYAKHEYDDLEQMTRTSYFGAKNEAVKLHGYHTVMRRYDDHGNPVEIRYFDVDEKTLIVADEGFARIVKAHDQHHQLMEQLVFGTHDERVTLSNGTHRIVTIRDELGRPTREEIWGPADPPNKLGATEYHYDGCGNIDEERHFGPDGKPVATQGVPCATKLSRFSDRQELLEQRCLGIDGALASHLANGAARIEYTYGQPGERTKELYYDERGRAFTAPLGFAGIIYKHDPLGREIEVIYVDARQSQVLTKLGYARVAYTYDERGNLVEQAFFLANDSPTLPVAKIESEFNVLRQKVRDRYLGPGSKPAALGGHGQHVTLYEYDNYGNVRALRYLDEQERPTRGYARGLDNTWQLCRRWVAQYGADGKQVGNGECQQALPPDGRGVL